MNIIKNKYVLLLLMPHILFSAREIRTTENRVHPLEQNQSSSWTSKFCFGCYPGNKVQPEVYGVDHSLEPIKNSSIQKIKPSNIVTKSLDLIDSSTTSENSILINLSERQKPVRKKTFLGSVTEIFSSSPASSQSVNTVDHRGVMPLHAAVIQGNVEKVIELLNAGAKVNYSNIHGDTALHLAMKYSGRDRDDGFEYAYIAQCLLEHGALCNISNKLGRTPLHEAVENLSLDSIHILISHKADVNVQDNNGYTPLMLVIRKNLSPIEIKPTVVHQLQADIVKLLLKVGADLNILCFDDAQSVYGFAQYQIQVRKNMVPEIADYIHYAQYPNSKKSMAL